MYWPKRFGSSLLITAQPQICLAALLFAALHVVIEYKNNIKVFYRMKESKIPASLEFMRLGSLVLIYFSVYSVVIMPSTGIGSLSCIIVLITLLFILLTPDSNGQKFSENKGGFFYIARRNTLLMPVILLIGLFIIKFLVIQNMADDYYDKYVRANKFIRYIFAILIILTVIFSVKVARIKLQKKNTASEEKNAASEKSAGKKVTAFFKYLWNNLVFPFLKLIGTLVTTLIKMVTELAASLTPMIWILVALVVFGLVVCIFAGVLIDGFLEGIVTMFEPLLDKMFDNGSNLISPDGKYKVFCFVIFALFLVYTGIFFVFEGRIKEEFSKDLLEEKLKNCKIDEEKLLLESKDKKLLEQNVLMNPDFVDKYIAAREKIAESESTES